MLSTKEQEEIEKMRSLFKNVWETMNAEKKQEYSLLSSTDALYCELRYSVRHIIDAFFPLDKKKSTEKSALKELERAKQHLERVLYDIPEAKILTVNDMIASLAEKHPGYEVAIWQYVDRYKNDSTDSRPLSELYRAIVETDEFEKTGVAYKKLCENYIVAAQMCYEFYSSSLMYHWWMALKKFRDKKTYRICLINVLCAIIGAIGGELLPNKHEGDINEGNNTPLQQDIKREVNESR